MRQLLLMLTVTLFSGCNNHQVKQLTGRPEFVTPENEIDYKKDVYKLFLGQTKDSLKTIVEIRRNFEAEWNVKPRDSIEHYMNISEELIRIATPGRTEVLPALYFTFHKGILTGFECPVVFEPEVRNEQSIYNFISALAPYFDKLKSGDNKRNLSRKFLLNFDNANREESFRIDTTRQYEILLLYKTNAK